DPERPVRRCSRVGHYRAHAVERVRLLAQPRSACCRIAADRTAKCDRRSDARRACAETRRAGSVKINQMAKAVSTNFTQYDVPNGMASSLRLYDGWCRPALSPLPIQMNAPGRAFSM